MITICGRGQFSAAIIVYCPIAVSAAGIQLLTKMNHINPQRRDVRQGYLLPVGQNVVCAQHPAQIRQDAAEVGVTLLLIMVGPEQSGPGLPGFGPVA
ncbi:MAG: hypothetical protein IPL78_16845 [Chloroflexi bacterium]|nr:hypothetical protein [Chloroflexota bacterium]